MNKILNSPPSARKLCTNKIAKKSNEGKRINPIFHFLFQSTFSLPFQFSYAIWCEWTTKFSFIAYLFTTHFFLIIFLIIQNWTLKRSRIFRGENWIFYEFFCSQCYLFWQIFGMRQMVWNGCKCWANQSWFLWRDF
jgi:hypothetical protein